MQFGDPPDHRQAQARRSAGITTMKTVKSARGSRRRKSWPVVGHDDRCAPLTEARLHHHSGAGVTQGIVNEVAQGNGYGVGIGTHFNVRSFDLDLNATLGCRRACILDQDRNQLIESQRSQFGRHESPGVEARERKHRVDHAGGAIHAVDEQRECRRAFNLIAGAQGHLRLCPQCGERCAQLVRRVCGQGALGKQGMLDSFEQAIDGRPDRLHLGRQVPDVNLRGASRLA